jgi:hypothetical protein
MLSLSPEDIQAIASEVVRQMRSIPQDGDVRMNKAEAARYLGVSARTFDRMRGDVKLLSPVSTTPLRWSRATLDQYKTTQRRLLMASIK